MFPSLLIPPSGQHLSAKGTTSVYYTLWDPEFSTNKKYQNREHKTHILQVGFEHAFSVFKRYKSHAVIDL